MEVTEPVNSQSQSDSDSDVTPVAPENILELSSPRTVVRNGKAAVRDDAANEHDSEPACSGNGVAATGMGNKRRRADRVSKIVPQPDPSIPQDSPMPASPEPKDPTPAADSEDDDTPVAPRRCRTKRNVIVDSSDSEGSDDDGGGKNDETWCPPGAKSKAPKLVRQLMILLVVIM